MRPHFIYASIAALLLAVSSARAAGVESPPPDVTRLLIHAPQPEYPPEARTRHIAGSGVFLLRVHIPSGRVTQVLIGRTTDSRALDAAAVKALLQWRFKPGAVPYREITRPRLSPPQTKKETLILLPMSFTL
jgi:TonB family protein